MDLNNLLRIIPYGPVVLIAFLVYVVVSKLIDKGFRFEVPPRKSRD